MSGKEVIRMFACCCDPKSFAEHFQCKTEETKDGVVIKVTAKDPEKAEALKKLYSAYQTLSGGKCCQ
jgi:hypothetical protein